MLWTFWILFYTIQINVVPFFMKTKSDFEIYCEVRIFLKRVTSSNKCIDFELISLFIQKIFLCWNLCRKFYIVQSNYFETRFGVWFVNNLTYISNDCKIQLSYTCNYYYLMIWIFIHTLDSVSTYHILRHGNNKKFITVIKHTKIANLCV